MSFLSVLKTIGSAFTRIIAIEKPLEPIIAVVPGGLAFETIFNTVVSVEQMIANALGANVPSNPALSAAKKAIAVQMIAATPAGAALSPEVVSNGIDQVVASLNSLQATQAQISAAAPVAAAGQ